MASSNSLLSEEQFLCPICLDVFTRPVSTPCGHNFCMSCITTYWDDTPNCQCPVCKETFDRRPDLRVNTFISGLALQFMSLQVKDDDMGSSDQQQANGSGEVLCDICADNQQEAVKSCLECLTSYCDVHLEPHRRAAGLKRHTLLDPLSTLEDRICKEHSRLLVMFCRNEEVLLCDACASLRHVNHDVVSMQRAYREMKALLLEEETKVQQMIQERLQKIQVMRDSIIQSKKETKDVIANSLQDLMELTTGIDKIHSGLVKMMEDKQKAAEEEADKFISSMKQEITELQTTAKKMEKLKQTNNQLCFLQSFPNSSLLPHTMDLSTFTFTRHVEIHRIQKVLSKSVSQMQTLLSKMNAEITQILNGTDVSNEATLRYMQQYEEDIKLDPDTAHPLLIISNDRKWVRYSMGSGLWGNQIPNPNMFTEHLAVLGQRGFSSCKFYFEVFVGEKSEWCLGVAKASIQRNGSLFRSSLSGLWAIWFLVDKFETFSSPNVPVHLGKVEKVGVFVDYNGGQISFYDVQSATLIYSFTECIFTEELYPYFNPCDNEYGSNLEPMIIVPVCRTD
uniref:E3 ubiquitin-protein ligase TRIM21-like n=1 Tax=Scatophagus argus TaxID=75038 RepID=UPI001ED7E065|nr:E3 ubiquitin-protein ligase TRIM21-like [Scatophagus argus]